MASSTGACTVSSSSNNKNDSINFITIFYTKQEKQKKEGAKFWKAYLHVYITLHHKHKNNFHKTYTITILYSHSMLVVTAKITCCSIPW